MANNTCNNNYTEEEFIESFGVKDEDTKKCNQCENMTYEDGILLCTKFMHKD